MTWTSFSSGINTNFSTELNSNIEGTLELIGKDHIRILYSGATIYSEDETDVFGECYIDSNGRNNYVDTTSTNTQYDSDAYCYFNTTTISNDTTSTDTTNDDDSFTNPSNAFDGNSSTAATISLSPTSEAALGKTFSKRAVGNVYVKASTPIGSYSQAWLQTYDGSTWTNYLSLWNVDNDSASFDGNIFVTGKVSGVRVKFRVDAGTAKIQSIYTLSYGESTSTAYEIYHNIPSGSFSSTCNSAFATALVAATESGASINYKLTNTSGDDSGWLSINTIEEFTAFTAEPETFIVRLSPTSSSPVSGLPAIYGIWLRAK